VLADRLGGVRHVAIADVQDPTVTEAGLIATRRATQCIEKSRH
jgi:hypothetical protein